MGNKRRQRPNKQRGMHRRLRNGKKPMSAEQKALRKKESEAQRERTKAALEKSRK
tara:strand:+ start:507 stop:671 length:165 start_codon:yes stop_codon:yes gene_type:complete